jgi:hypothetical protein
MRYHIPKDIFFFYLHFNTTILALHYYAELCCIFQNLNTTVLSPIRFKKICVINLTPGRNFISSIMTVTRNRYRDVR